MSMMFILIDSQKNHISDEFPYNRENLHTKNSLYQIIIHVPVWFMYNYQHQHLSSFFHCSEASKIANILIWELKFS